MPMADIAIRFDNSVKYDCKIKEGAVADTVAVEPVSTPKFPANREINREFFNFGLARGPEVAIRPMIQGL